VSSDGTQAETARQPALLDRGKLLDALAGGATVLTGNTRLARSLAADYERGMLAAGRRAWTTPTVLPLDAWLRGQYEEAALRSDPPLPRLLSPDQEAQVWAGIIAADGSALLRVDATAARAAASWKRVCEWRLPLGDRRFGDDPNTEAFRRWATRFERASSDGDWIAGAGLASRLAQMVTAGACVPPQRALLTGFYELTPAVRELAAALSAAGCELAWVESAGVDGQVAVFRAEDPRQEMLAAAGWARRLLQQRPEARIGIIVPDLAACRAALANILTRTLDPASLTPGAGPQARPWNLSLGRPLADYPVIATALRLLGLMQSPVELETLGLLLRSPHWALARDAAERAAELDRRALLDRRLRKRGDARIALSAVSWQAALGREDGAVQPWTSPRLAECLGQLQRAARQLPAQAATGTWASQFAQWLRSAGWAGTDGKGRPLDSREYQAVEAWQDLLSRFSSLEDFAGTLGLPAALALLGRLAAGTLFQPRTGDAPLQVLGLHEAIGQHFDHLWVMGMHDGAWPPPANPDPFLPRGLQRERSLPHSGPELELDWAARVTEQLGGAAAEVVFSHPVREGGEELAGSPLIAAWPLLDDDFGDLPEADAWANVLRNSGVSERVSPPRPLPLDTGTMRGGSALLRDQALCPFRAFAAHRLGAQPLDRVQAGLDAARRGRLLHAVLERLWGELQSQATLLELDDAGLRGLLRAAVDEVLEGQRRRSPHTFTSRFRSLEARRLEQRVLEWLAVERERSPFTVLGRESKHEFEVAGLRLRLQLDRVDALADGSRAVIDYKTGQVRPTAWFGPRPEEPQLPLYGLASRAAEPDTPVAAVAFAQLRPGRAAFSGVVREAGILPGLPSRRAGPLRDAAEQWPAVLDEWDAELRRLAQDFVAGGAAVAPKRGLQTCRDSYCELAPLCRVREVLPEAGADDADDADDADWREAEDG
jgi:probable DNA repair protein